MSHSFQGLWIPKVVYLDKALKAVEKLLFSEISWLGEDSGCFAENQHFCDHLGLSERQVQRILKKLQDKGYIEVILNKKKNTRRILSKIEEKHPSKTPKKSTKIDRDFSPTPRQNCHDLATEASSPNDKNVVSTIYENKTIKYKEKVESKQEKNRNEFVKQVQFPQSPSPVENFSEIDWKESKETLLHFEKVFGVKIKDSLQKKNQEHVLRLRKKHPDITIEDCKHAIEMAKKYWTGDFRSNCHPRLIFKPERFEELICYPRPIKVEDPNDEIILVEVDKAKTIIKEQLQGFIQQISSKGQQAFSYFLEEKINGKKQVIYDPLYADCHIFLVSQREREKKQEQEELEERRKQSLLVSSFEEYKHCFQANKLNILNTRTLDLMYPKYKAMRVELEAEEKRTARKKNMGNIREFLLAENSKIRLRA